MILFWLLWTVISIELCRHNVRAAWHAYDEAMSRAIPITPLWWLMGAEALQPPATGRIVAGRAVAWLLVGAICEAMIGGGL